MLKVKPGSLKIGRLRPFLMPGVIVVFIFVSGLVLIRPRLNEIFSIQKNLKKEEGRLTQLTAKTAALEGLDQVELSEKAEIVAEALPSEKDVPLLLSVLKNLAARNNIELRSLEVNPGELATPSAEGKKEELSFLSFKILTGGQMSDFKEFLSQLTKIAPLMGVESIGIETEGMTSSLQASFPLNAPFLALPATLGVPEKPLSQITREEEEIYQKLVQLEFSLVKEELPLVPVGKEDLFAF